MRLGWLGVAFLCCLQTAAGGESPSETVQRGFDAYKAHRCPEAIGILKDAVAAPGFSQLGGELQYSGLWALSVCHYLTGDYRAASQGAQRLTANPFADFETWELRFWSGLAAQDTESSAIALSYLAEHHLQSLAELEAQTLFQFVEAQKKTPAGRTQNAEILQKLFAANWRPAKEPANSLDMLWLELIRADLKAGRLEHARLVAATITSPMAREVMWAEKTFDPLTGGDPAKFGIAAYYDAEVARERAEMAAHPDLLSYVSNLAQLLNKLDRQEEALALLDDTLAKMKVSGRFRDMQRQANWIQNYRSNVLSDMGRGESGRAQMEAAVQENEKEGRDKVSQAINLAGIYCSQGLPEEGLKVLKRVDTKNASPYGVMAREETRACAYALQNDKAGLAQSVAFAQAHSKDAPLLAIQVALYAKDADGAARLMLGFLADPDTRWQVLSRLHKNKASRYQAAETEKDLPGLKWSTLTERADVKAAIETYGRVLDLPTIEGWI